jgi:hypothetical protein
MEQMMKRLVAAIEKVCSLASQIDANLEQMKTEIRTNQERMEPSYNVIIITTALQPQVGLSLLQNIFPGVCIHCCSSPSTYTDISQIFFRII